jgi:hypothetical protein
MKKVLILIVTILVITVFTGVICYADVINGCKQKKTGQLRIVNDPSQCQPNEVPISWNQGPSGAVTFYKIFETFKLPAHSANYFSICCDPDDFVTGGAGSSFPIDTTRVYDNEAISNGASWCWRVAALNTGDTESDVYINAICAKTSQ